MTILTLGPDGAASFPEPEVEPCRTSPAVAATAAISHPLTDVDSHAIPPHDLDNGLQVIAELNDQARLGRRGVLRQDGEPRRVGRGGRGLALPRAHDLQGDARGATPWPSTATSTASGPSTTPRPRRRTRSTTSPACPSTCPQAFDVLSDILRPTSREDDFETEKKVIIEEIRMYLDNPMSVAYEAAKAAHFGAAPAGQEHPRHGRVDHGA